AITHGVVDLRSRDIFALPAEGVANAIDEVEKALVIELHQIAGAEPGIAVSEDIAQNLLLCLAGVGIALEAASAFICGADAADGFTSLAAGAGHAKAVGIAQGHPGAGIELDDRRRETMREQRRNAADRARSALDIEQREIAFGRRVEFEDARKGKARLEILPDVAAQAVAATEPQVVMVLVFRRRRLQKIAAELADILEQGAVVANDVGPEIRRREFVCDHHRATSGEHAAGRDDAA